MTSIIDSEDVFMWPDGTWCYRCDYPEMGYMSDDFEVLPYGSEKWAVWDAITDSVPF